MTSILIIDDDSELCELLCEYLQPEGFTVETTGNSREGLARALSGDHALVVLDVMLPRISGFELLRRLRTASEIPVLMLTARGEEIDRIVGLEMGADDYLPKPFNPRELVARLRAIGRRAGPLEKNAKDTQPADTISVGDLVLELRTRRVKKAGRQVNVTGAEFTLLRQLLEEAGRVVSRERLAETVLGRRLMMFDRSIDVHVSNLRRKLGPERDGTERIRTVRGVGYMVLTAGGNGGPGPERS